TPFPATTLFRSDAMDQRRLFRHRFHDPFCFSPDIICCFIFLTAHSVLTPALPFLCGDRPAPHGNTRQPPVPPAEMPPPEFQSSVRRSYAGNSSSPHTPPEKPGFPAPRSQWNPPRCSPAVPSPERRETPAALRGASPGSDISGTGTPRFLRSECRR